MMRKILLLVISFLVCSLALSSALWPKKAFACNLNNCTYPNCSASIDCDDCDWCDDLNSSTPFPKLNNPILPPQLRNLSGVEFIQRAVTIGVSLLLVAGAVVFVFIFLIGGIRWITSAGDKAAMEGARGQVTNALIGLAILLSVFAIIQLLGSIFGISLTKLSFPTL